MFKNKIAVIVSVITIFLMGCSNSVDYKADLEDAENIESASMNETESEEPVEQESSSSYFEEESINELTETDVTNDIYEDNEEETITLPISDVGISAYYPYISDVLEPEMGLLDLGTKNHDFTYDIDAEVSERGWDERTGIVSVYVTDLDGDGVEDMVLLAVDNVTNDEYDYSCPALYIYVYTIENNKVVCKGKELLDDYWDNLQIAKASLMIYTDENGNKTIWYESFHCYQLYDYSMPYFVSLKYENNQLVKEISLYQTDGGSDEKVYSVINEQTGDETIVWREYVDDCEMYDAFVKAFEQYANMPDTDEVMEGWYYNIPSWRSQSEVIASIKNDYSQQGKECHSVMTYSDFTGLRGQLE